MPPSFVLGLMGSAPSGGLSSSEQLSALLTLAAKHNINDLDTARAYSSSMGSAEALLGSVDKSLTSKFRIDTKAPAFVPGSLSAENITSNCALSLKELKEDKCHYYYLHGPDDKTPYKEKVDALAKLYSEGKFENWGVSNISPDELRNMYDYCKEKGYPTPKVYQGIYNPVHRSAETGLFPLLKELNVRFYAYSPLAGGLFAKSIEQVLHPEKGSRYDQMKVFGGMYSSNPTMVDGIRELARTCEGNGLTLLEATLRWLRWHSGLGENHGIIVGASSVSQLEQTVEYVGGEKLDKEVAEAFEKLWDQVKENPLPAWISAAAAKSGKLEPEKKV